MTILGDILTRTIYLSKELMQFEAVKIIAWIVIIGKEGMPQGRGTIKQIAESFNLRGWQVVAS